MALKFTPGVTATLAVGAGLALALAGCSSSSTPSGSSSASGSAAATAAAPYNFGTVDAAKGTPVVFAALNLELGPVTFPEVLASEEAAAAYVNQYKGGIDGHPIKIVSCQTDGTPATSAQCANKLLADHPVAVFGAADTGSPGAIPVWARAGVPYLGGIPFTPVEQNSPDAVIFSSAGLGDPAAASAYIGTTLKAKSAVVIYTSDTQGTTSANGIMIPTMKRAGVTKVTGIPIAPTSSDVTSAVASAVSAHPDAIYIDAPAACPNILSSLKQLGSTAKVFGIDPCTSPAAVAASNGGADNMYFPSPVVDPTGASADAKLFDAAVAKWAPAHTALDAVAAVGFATVIDVQAGLAKFTTADLTKDKILAAFKTGSNHPNFMSHPYTCDGKAILGATAICDAHVQIRQFKGNSVALVSNGWITAGTAYVPAAR